MALAIALVPALPAHSQAPTARAAQAAEQRVQKARERGYWVVEEGDYLYRIARSFTEGEVQARALVAELEAMNPNALMGSRPAKLVVGARVHLPRRLHAPGAGGAVASGTSASGVAASGAVASTAASEAPRAESSATPRSRPTAPVAPLPGAGVPPIAANAPPPRAPDPPPRAPVYVDRLISGGTDDPAASLDESARDASPGLRQWSAELRSEHRRQSDGGSLQADGIIARYATETERYGDLSLTGQATHTQPFPGDPQGKRTQGSGTLRHDNFALGNAWNANSALGVVRPLLPIWLTTSYRVSFSPSMLAGAETILTSPGDDIRVSVGQVGQLAGVGIQQFERTSGEQAAASYTRRFDAGWSVGGAVIGVRDSQAIADHTTATLGVNREPGGGFPGIKLQGALTDDGEGAAWFDAYARTGRLVQRFGAYHVDPDFRFGESTAARDVRGGYWRGEYRAAGQFFSFGAEASQDNLNRDPTRGGNETVGGYANVSLRLDRTLQVGGGASLRSEEPRTPSGVARRVGYANAYVSKSWDLGVSRLDANYNTSRPDTGGNERTRSASWIQEWPRLGPVDINTLVNVTDEDLADRQVRRRLANLQARGPIYGTLRWDGAITFVDVEDSSGSERNYNTSLSLDWSPLQSWTFQLQWLRNRIQPGPDNPLSPFLKDEVVQVNARYEDSAGTPYPRVAGGRGATGRVAGSVFYDENGDGVRQANERGVTGVAVVLDERQSATTDNDGRFQFSLVPAGTHRIRVLLERVALPWGLDDDSPREVRVDARGDARIDIGLTRISP